MVGYGQHETYYQWFGFSVIFEVVQALVQLLPLLLGKQQILVLKLPSEGKEFKLIVISKHIKVLEIFKAQLIIRPLEISIDDILFPPRPLILQLVVLFDLHQKPFHFFLEAPEGGTTEDVIMRVPFFQHIEEAKRIIDGMIPTQITSVLLIALTMMEIVLGVVFMGDQFCQRLVWDFDWWFADIVQGEVEDLVPQLADLFGDYGYCYLRHVYLLFLINSYRVDQYNHFARKWSGKRKEGRQRWGISRRVGVGCEFVKFVARL